MTERGPSAVIDPEAPPVLNESLKPYSQTIDRVVNTLHKQALSENIKVPELGPVTNLQKNGLGKSWHWVDHATDGVLAQTSLCLSSTDQGTQDEIIEPKGITLKIVSHISTNEGDDSIDWQNIARERAWSIEDLLVKHEMQSDFEYTVASGLSESWQDLAEKDDIIKFLRTKKK